MRRLNVFLITALLAFCLTACNSEEPESTGEEVTPEIIEQVVIDEVEDYDSLSFSELEVLCYEDDPEAEYQLGIIYEYGNDEINQDFAKAMEWYERAAMWDHADAYSALGYFYLTGTYVEQDYDLAQVNFEQAVMLGSKEAEVGLARVYLASVTNEEIESIQPENLEGLTISDEDQLKIDEINDICAKAFGLIKDAAKDNNPDGLYYLGYCYEHGIGTVKDLTNALSTYKKAAFVDANGIRDQQAKDDANIAVAMMYMNGIGVELDTEKAFEYFNIAADNGSAKAQYYVGQMYENGISVEQDYSLALEYYLKAADSDFSPALNQIGYLYFNGYGVDVDFSSTVYYQKLAALQGYAPAQVNLGYLYENGYGVERNLNTALTYYEFAADSNYEGAEEAALRVRALMNEET